MPVDLSKHPAQPASTPRTRRPTKKDADEDRFDSTHAREIELKRSRGEISCAECRRCDQPHSPAIRLPADPVPACSFRRLKVRCTACVLAQHGPQDPRTHYRTQQIRCDKTIPCKSCQVRPFRVRRAATVRVCSYCNPLRSSVEDVQPSVQTVRAERNVHARLPLTEHRCRSQGASPQDKAPGEHPHLSLSLSVSVPLTPYHLRFVLAATEYLHKRIAKMTERIRQLEDALAILQARCSNETHPLLRDEDVTSKMEPEDEEAGPDVEPARNAEIIDAFGTLSVSHHGVSRFFGPTGGSEVRV